MFDRLRERQGIPEGIRSLASERKYGLALQRLCEPGSDLQGSRWLQGLECPGGEELALQHLCRATGFLPDIRADLERELFFRDQDLFRQQLDLIFLDTTSTYVFREEETEVCRRGYSRDRRPELLQLALCVAVHSQGWPVAREICRPGSHSIGSLPNGGNGFASVGW